MNPKLKEKLLESLMAVLPITLIVLALSVALVPMDVGTAVMFTVGAELPLRARRVSISRPSTR